jgi:type VI secretion system secreted protein VgrG
MPRVFELVTPLGKDVLFFRAMRGSEQLGRLSHFELSTLSSNGDIRLGDLLGKNVTVRVELRGGGFRFFNGFVTSFGQEGTVGRFFHYRLTVEPWLWFLTRTTDCRIFQDKTAPEIIKEIFAEHPVAAFEDLLTGKHPKREYCVQYRETDFNFVSRLMEEEGIYYFFDHQDGRHALKMVDSISGHKVLQNRASITFIPPGNAVRDDDEFIHAWTFSQSIKSGVVALDDYDFIKPRADLGVKAQIIEKHDNAEFEVFDWPGEYHETDDGEQYARARIEELHSEFDRAEAECNVKEIAVGHLFTLANAPRRDQEREYLITSARYDLRDNPFETAPGAPTGYNCRFTVLHTRQQFRPERVTLEPRMTGPQTAVVMAPPNEEIFCDKFGRIKVLFHWDRQGKKKRDENTSCFLRVAQPWAGTGWGAIFLPRKGQEVLVDFLEGDPDRPIIIGSVYNSDEMPPYKLPDFKTMSTLKSRSTLNGDPKEFNELRFEDKKGKEQVFIHSQRRMDVRVRQSMFETIGGARNTGIGGEYALTVGGSHDLHVKGDIFARGDGKVDASTGGAVNLKVGATSKHYATGAKEINARSVTIEGLTSIVLKVGSSFVEVSPMGITLQGPLVRINSGGAATGTSGIDYDDPLDAAEADTGEPGFLDRPRTGGGGGRKHHHETGYHARAVTFNPATNIFNYGGTGIAVTGTPDFANKTLQTLASLDGTPTGHQLIDNLQSNGHTATIKQATPAEAAANGGGVTTGVQPAMSNGTGSDSTVAWAPGTNAQYTDQNGVNHTQPDEALLGHELIHADHNANGASLNGVPDPADATGNQEESRTIGINNHAGEPVSENNILKDMGQDWRRTDHDSNAHTAP